MYQPSMPSPQSCRISPMPALPTEKVSLPPFSVKMSAPALSALLLLMTVLRPRTAEQPASMRRPPPTAPLALKPFLGVALLFWMVTREASSMVRLRWEPPMARHAIPVALLSEMFRVLFRTLSEPFKSPPVSLTPHVISTEALPLSSVLVTVTVELMNSPLPVMRMLP